MNKKILLIILSMVFVISSASCKNEVNAVSSSVLKKPQTQAVNSHEDSLGKTVMGIKVVVRAPSNEETGVKTYLVFENENDNCVLYTYHFYPDNTFYDKDLRYYEDTNADISYDENALMIKVKGTSPYETLEGAYAAYYSANGFTII